MTHVKPVRAENTEAMQIAGLREHYTSKTVNDIPALWQRLSPYFGRIPSQVGKITYGVVMNMHAGVDGFDYIAGVEVSGVENLPEGFSHVTIPPLKFFVFIHDDNVSKLKDTMSEIWYKWLPDSGYEAASDAGAPCMIERYGEGFDPKTGMGDMEVWLAVEN